MKPYLRRIKIIASMLLISVLSASCDSFIDEQPISEISTTGFWNSNEDAKAGIAGIYDAMQPTYRTKHFLWGEFRSDSYVAATAGGLDFREMVLQSITPGNAQALRWDEFYEMINRANQAIKYIPTIQGYDKNLLAEAYAVRAFAYFDAIRVWGDVPLFLEPTESISNLQKPRTSGDDIMRDVIIPDMLKAEELMAKPDSKFRFSKASIYCLQADVYMWQKEYGKAKTSIENMIDLGVHSLVNSVDAWRDLFYNTPNSPDTPNGRGKIQTGPELIFSIRYDLAEEQRSPGNNLGNRSGVFQLFFAGIPTYYISSVLEDKWVERFPIDQEGWEAKYPDTEPAVTTELGPVYGDWRYFLSREGQFEGNSGSARVAKWAYSNFNPAFDDTDIVIYRYAGMLYLLAEAENRLNEDGVRALEIINQIRTARKLPTVTMDEFGSTPDERETYILDEKQFELLGEGKRWWDLRRTNKVLEVLNPILDSIPEATTITEDRLLFPIYFEHLIENPNLTQNSGY